MTLTIAEKNKRHVDSQRRYKETHYEEFRKWYNSAGKQREAKERIKIKLEVLTHYGNGKCACVMCGESRLACLSIDHIDGGGKSHKRALGRYGSPFYRWLIKQGFPDGYQTLCMNCQFSKAFLDRSWDEFREHNGGTE